VLDPCANGWRIGGVDGARYFARVEFPSILVGHNGRMEAEYGAGGDADSVPRNGAED